MQLQLEQLGKRFIREWIFRRLSVDLPAGSRVAVTGPNGSGKSTLLQVIAGSMPATEGIIQYGSVSDDAVYRHVVIAAPYLELIEEFTLTELVDFHRKFKPLKQGLSTPDFIECLDLTASRNKYIRNFSSGMKQRLKLGLAFWSEARLVILDEPTSNLDARNTDWYLREVQQLTGDQIILIGSNVPSEYAFCTQAIDIQQYK